MKAFFDDWEDGELDQLVRDFDIKPADVEGCEFLYASYTYEDYSGSAYVLFRKAGKLFQVEGSHCSCYGLEGQWEPDEVVPEQLILRLKKGAFPESDSKALSIILKEMI